MYQFDNDSTHNSQSAILNNPRTSTSPPLKPTDDAIEAIIQQATSARPSPDGRPLRDTRTQLFVGNLPYRVRWQDLKDLFRKAGTVLRADVSLGPDNRSRGYGTVLLATAEDAGRAVDMFNGHTWQTRVLEVRLDRLLPEYDSQLPVASSSTGTSSSSHPSLGSSSHLGSTSSVADEIEYMTLYHANDPSSSRNLFVGNLPFHCQWQDLKDLFRQAGTILRADVALGPDGRSRGFGTVVFATDYDAERAVKMFNGYDYNGRVLKVHFDKFSHASQPVTNAGSPVGSSSPSHTQSHPKQIKLPPGFMYEYVAPSGPTSPYDLFSQLQMQMQQQQRQHHQQPQTLHQPQAQYLHQDMLQQRQQQLHSRLFNQKSPLDADNLASTLASTSLSKYSQARPQPSHKPPPMSATTSSGSTTTTASSSSELSLPSTSASSISQSQSPIHAQQHPHHPHHPGPITIPPMAPVTFPMSPHTPHASGMSLSPLHHPSMGSPYHLYPSSSAAAHSAAYQQRQHQHHQHHPQVTPHGLPPITPSMPPFTFLPPPSHQQQRQQQQQQQQQYAYRHHTATSSTGVSSASGGAHPSGSGSVSSPSMSYSSATAGTAQPGRRPFSATPNLHFVIPLPSPGLMMSAQQPQSSPPMHLRLNLAGVHGPFSPGVVMSPGTFYGRPGEVPNPNPFINAAVGAPVHIHSPGAHEGPGPGMQPPTHGAHFYAMSNPKKGPPSGMEPKGYFDPMYFPVGGVAHVGGSGLANEVLQEKRLSAGAAATGSMDDNSPPGDASVDTCTGTSAVSSSSSLTGTTSRQGSNEGGSRVRELEAESALELESASIGAAMISRTQSVEYAKTAAPAEGVPEALHRSDSDPAKSGHVRTSNAADQEDVASRTTAPAPPELKLPAHVPWRTMAIGAPATTSTTTTAMIPPPPPQ